MLVSELKSRPRPLGEEVYASNRPHKFTDYNKIETFGATFVRKGTIIQAWIS